MTSTAQNNRVSINVYNNPINNKKNNMTTESVPAALSEQSLAYTQLKFLHRHQPLYLWTNLAAIALASIYLGLSYPHYLIYIVVMSVLLLGMSGLCWQWGRVFQSKTNHSQKDLDHFANQYVFHTTIINSLWGLSGLFFIFFQESNWNYFYVILLLGISLSCLPLLSLTPLFRLLQLSVLLIPTILALIILFSISHLVLIITILLFSAVLWWVAALINQLLMQWYDTLTALQQQANQDQLTQVYNRRFFERTLKSEWQRAARTQASVALLMVDIDHFKRFNDLNGHEKANQCLREIAHTIESVARRTSDFIARYKEDEFAVLLANTNEEEAQLVAERIREAIEALEIQFSTDNFQKMLTVSIGVASCSPIPPSHTPQPLDSSIQGTSTLFPAVLLGCVERALYRAKKGSRNQVVVEKCQDETISMAQRHVEELQSKEQA